MHSFQHGKNALALFSAKVTKYRRFQPTWIVLEDRAVPATLTVNSLADGAVNLSDSTITLRDAIAAANNDVRVSPGGPSGSGNDVIQFASSLFQNGAGTISFTAGQMDIGTSMVITGPGASLLTLDGNLGTRHFFVANSAAFLTVSISGMTFTRGSVGSTSLEISGGSIGNSEDLSITRCVFTSNQASASGGAIANLGTLAVTESTFADNVADDFGGAIYNRFTSAVVSNSTFVTNLASFGGGLFNDGGTVAIINSTFTGNRVVNSGAGIRNFQGSLDLRNSTIIGNRADRDNDGSGLGGGFDTTNTNVRSHNTIIAGNVRGSGNTPSDINGIIQQASANNLIGDAATSGGLTHGPNGNIVGNNGSGTINVNSVVDTNLVSNGGPTQTHALVSNSPAINAGNNDLIPNGVTTDQRGSTRIVDGTVDIGSFEASVSTPPPNGTTSVNIDPILGLDSLVITDVDGNRADNLLIRLSANGTQVIVSDPGATFSSDEGTVSADRHTVTINLSAFAGGRIQVNLAGGDDIVTLDWSAGLVAPTGTGSVFVNAGTGSDVLSIVGDGSSYVRYITGLIEEADNSASIRRVASNRTLQHFLSNLETVSITQVGTLDFLTRNQDDFVNYARLNASQGRITGTSGGLSFLPVNWSATPTLYLYTSNNDTTTSTNEANINSGALGVPGLKNFIYSGGMGEDALRIGSNDLLLPVSGGQILFNGGLGVRDRLVVSGNTNFTLNNFRLLAASGGFVRSVNTEHVVIQGGSGNNIINAAAYSGNTILDGGLGNDSITGGTGRDIIFGGTGTDSLDGRSGEDILIGGGTSLDIAGSAGSLIADEWFGGSAYAVRVGNLRNGGGANGSIRFTTTNTPTDAATDTIFGGADLDWFWTYTPSDSLRDRTSSESVR